MHLVSVDDDGAEYMATFTHGKLESLDPIVGRASDADAYRCLGAKGRCGHHVASAVMVSWVDNCIPAEYTTRLGRGNRGWYAAFTWVSAHDEGNASASKKET